MMAKLFVGDMIPPKFKNTFVCEIDTMMGDGDDWDTIELPFKEEDYDSLAKVLEKAKDCRNSDKYHTIENAYKFFGKVDYDSRLEEWKFDYDADEYYTYESHKIFYYDQEGRKYNVSVE